MIVTFANALSEPSNRATLAFRQRLEDLQWEGVLETATSLASVYVRFDPSIVDHHRLQDMLQEQLEARAWYQEQLPAGRRFWRVPTVYGTDLAPQLAEAADAAGMSEAQAIETLGAARVRVLTIGFAPGQPYLGPLGQEWDLPRQTALTPMVPRGALVLAVRQFVLFSSATPTGWRHVGQTGFMVFRPDAEAPFALRAGDELQFEPVSRSDFVKLRARDEHMGGATAHEIPA